MSSRKFEGFAQREERKDEKIERERESSLHLTRKDSEENLTDP